MKRFLSMLLSVVVLLSLIAAVPTTAYATEVSEDNLLSATGWVQQGGKWYYKSNGTNLTGWQQIGGKWYYFNTSGVMQTGWQKVGGQWYYLKASGEMQTGWLQYGSKWYYLKPSGAMATGRFDMGELADSGWHNAYRDLLEQDAQNGYEVATYKLFYIDDDSVPELALLWVKEIDGVKMEGLRVSSYRNGNLKTNEIIKWQYMERITKMCYDLGSGVYYASGGFMGYYWSTVYLLDNGNFTKLGDGTQELGDCMWNGERLSEKEYNDKLDAYATVRMDFSDAMGNEAFRTKLWSSYETWLAEYERYYDFGADGIMATGWRQTDGKWYYFGSDGMIKTGWVTVGNSRYYFDTHGVMRTGWIYRNGNRYYLRASGAMATGSLKLGDKTYNFGSDGVCLNY